MKDFLKFCGAAILLAITAAICFGVIFIAGFLVSRMFENTAKADYRQQSAQIDTLAAKYWLNEYQPYPNATPRGIVMDWPTYIRSRKWCYERYQLPETIFTKELSVQ